MMNLTFPIVLAIAGIAAVLIGVIGRLRIKDFDAGTESTPARVIVGLFGVALLIAAYFVYQSDKPAPSSGNVNLNSNVSATPSAAPASSSEITIKSPGPNESLSVETDDGAAVIPVTGSLTGDLSNLRVYVFASTQASEWWYHEAVKPEQNGNWSTSVLAGSREQPAKAKQKVRIRAIAATDDDIRRATENSGSKMVKDFSSFPSHRLSIETTVTITPVKN